MLTKTGQAALSDIQSRQRVWADKIGKEIGQVELEQAQELLARIAGAVADTPTRAF